jgi:hypothetical protein
MKKPQAPNLQPVNETADALIAVANNLHALCELIGAALPPKPFRLLMTDPQGNHRYITRDRSGHVNFFNGDLRVIDPSQFFSRAAALVFALEDAADGIAAGDVVYTWEHVGGVAFSVSTLPDGAS